MIETIIAERYARALISLAKENGKPVIDRFANELSQFVSLCQSHAGLLPTLSDRYHDLFARERIVADLADKAQFDPIVKNFLKLLIRKGRMALIATISQEYQTLAHREMGRLVIKVVSAEPLNDQLYQEISDVFAKTNARQVVLEKQVLPDVMGGVRVHVGDRVYDGTLRHQMEKIKQSLQG